MPRKKKETIETKNDVLQDLAAVVAADLNDQYKNTLGEIAYTDNIDDIVGWLGTGCDMLDLAVSNRPNGGLPVGRIVEITGLEASGKSLLSAQICAQAQKAGGLAIYFDTEFAFSAEFFKALGVNVHKRWIYSQMNVLEDIFDVIEKAVTKARERDSQKPIVIVIDSIMGATTKIENAADYEKDGWATAKAIVLSKAMRKITQLISRQKVLLILVNQLRVKLGVMFGDPYTTSGGKAVGFHSSVRLRLKSKGQIKLGKSGPDPVIGVSTEAKIFKNRVGPPKKTVIFDIYFDSGIDNYGSWLNTMKDYNICSKAGAWYRYDFVDKETGEVNEIKFQSKDFQNLVEGNAALRQAIYDDICDKYIMKYKKSDFGIDDIEIVEEEHIGD